MNKTYTISYYSPSTPPYKSSLIVTAKAETVEKAQELILETGIRQEWLNQGVKQGWLIYTVVVNVPTNKLMDELDRVEMEVHRAVEAYARRAVQSPPSDEWIGIFEDIAVKTKKLTDIKDKIRYYLNGGL